jgi:hypothetical protein
MKEELNPLLQTSLYAVRITVKPKNSLTNTLHPEHCKFIIVNRRLLAAGERGRYVD